MLKKIILSLVVMFLFSCKNDKQNDNVTKDFTLINAVPIGSTIIIETQSLDQFKTRLYESEVWKTTKDLHWNKSTRAFFDQILEIVPQKDYNENFIITSTLSGGHSFDYLLLKYVDAEEEKEYADRLKSNYKVSSMVYDKVNLYALEKGKDRLYFAIHNNIFLLSEEKLLVEEGIRQLNADSSILSNEDFKKIYEATDSNKDANIFIQYTDFNQLAKNYFKNANTKWMKFLADWSAIEIDFSSNNIELEGVTIANFVKASYGSIFKDLKANNKEILNQLPNTVAALVYISIDDYTTFSQNYERYLNTSQILFKKQKNLETYKEYNPIKEFTKWIGKEVVIAYLSEEDTKVFNELFIVESIDDIVAKEVLDKISNTVTDYRGFKINQIQYETILQDVFGNYVEELKKPVYTLIDNYVVFANSENSLKSYVNDVLLQNYFVKNNSNADFIKSFNSKGHVFAMGNGSEGIGLIKSFLDKEKAADYSKNKKALSKIDHMGFQINFDEHIGFTQCLITVNKNDSDSNSSKSVAQLWNQSFSGKLKQIDLVRNHKTKEKELAIQDDTNTLYLVSNSGKKLWEKKLEEPILGKIHQMDIFKNGRLQLVFNTKSKLHVLDRNGKEVKPFPIKLSKPATAGCGLFDYDKARNYRILIPQGATMTMYNQSGKVVTGFKYGMGKSVNRMPKHIRIGGKDHIVTTATDGSVIILTRVGTSRANVAEKFSMKGDFNFIKDQIVFQTDDDKTVKIDFKGKISQSANASKDIMTRNFKNGVLHLLNDEVIFKGKNTIEHDLDEVNDYTVDFYEDTNHQFLIVIDNTLKQLLVIDENEKILNGFPVFGESKAQIYKEKGSYYLITQSSIDNSILYYKLR
ncbi:hypothetical protein UJ101_00714 [Flavobacteriaceae bacterium UJ101]|nr:hypothetical protein UJ101_00714 [Flavobacteriaceae bacterium UJ101]